MHSRFICLFFVSFLLLANRSSFGQTSPKDSVSASKKELKSQQLADDSTAWLRNDTSSVKKKKHSPTKATILSTVCPGLGQVYNHQYWKVPIIGGLGAFLAIMISTNNFDYKQAKNDYRTRLENEADPLYISKSPDFDISKYDAYDIANPANGPGSGVRTYNTSQLRLTRDTYRRDRDFYIIMSGVLYALNIIDATVFAHLREFEVSEKLSMRFDPDIRFTNTYQPITGVSCSLHFK